MAPPDLFAALDVQTGKVVGTCRPQHRAQKFRAFLDLIDRNVPPDLDIHLVLDNAATHCPKGMRSIKTPLIQRWLPKRPPF